MSSRNTNLAAVPRTDDFNPAVLETGTELEASSNQHSPFSLYVPDESAVRTTAFELFGTLLPESVIRNIIADSEEVAHSTRKIIQEHMRMGGKFLNIRRAVD